MDNNNSSNKGVMALLIVIIVIVAVLCVLFATGTISFNKNKNTNTTNDNQQSNENVQSNESNSIMTKLVNNLNDSNSETTFNGITVKVEQSVEDMVCNATSFTINDNDVLKDNGSCIKSYEFYDNNVIIMSSHTSGTVLTIYNVPTKTTIIKYSGSESTLEGYFVDSYTTNGNIITIEARGCGAQCGKEDIKETAEFKIEYTNNSFSTPELITKTTG